MDAPIKHLQLYHATFIYRPGYLGSAHNNRHICLALILLAGLTLYIIVALLVETKLIAFST